MPIAGILAEKYLKAHRGISGDLPEDFRFAKSIRHFETGVWQPALIAPIRDAQHHMTGVVRIFLDQDGRQYQALYQDAQGQEQRASAKANLGTVGQGSVRIQEGIDPSTLWFAEGI